MHTLTHTHQLSSTLSHTEGKYRTQCDGSPYILCHYWQHWHKEQNTHLQILRVFT